jgi:predicted PilT family ATPase
MLGLLQRRRIDKKALDISVCGKPFFPKSTFSANVAELFQGLLLTIRI